MANEYCPSSSTVARHFRTIPIGVVQALVGNKPFCKLTSRKP
jgi:hypothetical protein